MLGSERVKQATFFFFFLVPSVAAGSKLLTKSRSQISIVGSIVPTATKLPAIELENSCPPSSSSTGDTVLKKMLVIRAGIHKILVRIAKRKDSVCPAFLGILGRHLVFGIL